MSDDLEEKIKAIVEALEHYKLVLKHGAYKRKHLVVIEGGKKDGNK